MLKNVRFAKALLFAVCLSLALGLAATALATDVITETDHVWGIRVQIKDANCSEPPTFQYTCTVPGCGATKILQEGTTNGQHQWGEWIVDSQATCTTAGARHRQCMINVHHTETQTVPALGHDLQWRITVAATCTNTGMREQYCTRCGQVISTEIIPMGSHVWGPWVTIKEPTCLEAGEQRHSCTICGATENAPYGAALGHNWGPWNITVAATCDSNGSRTRVCQRNPAHVETEVIPSPGHRWTAWKRIKEPTFWEKGSEQRYCTVCGKTETRELDTIIYPNATLCAFGPRLKESNLYPNYSDKWYMFTPFDASMNGSQTFELVAADSVIVGDVTLTIRDGFLTIDYTLKGNDAIQVTLEFFTVLGRIGELSSYEPEGLMSMKVNRNQPINLAEQFPGDTHLVLYFCSRCSLRNSPAFKSLSYNSTPHRALLDQMRALMD